MQLTEARDAARAVMERLERGAPLIPAAPHPRSPAVLTLGGALDAFEAFRRQEGRRIRSLDASQRILRRELAPWLDLPLGSFGKPELRQARDAVVARGALFAANRLLDHASPFLRWASQEDLIQHAFANDVRKPAAERKRDRVLTPAELRAIWHGAMTLDRGPSSRAYGRLIQFLMTCGQRRGEGASLRHANILDGVWRQAPENNKSNRAHAIKLPPPAIEIVGRGEPAELVFRGVSGGLGGWAKLKFWLDAACGVSDWRIHDIRRSVASGMMDLGIAHDVIEAVLNHALVGVRAHYLHGGMERLKADALAHWADHLSRIVMAPTVTSLAEWRQG